MPPRFSMKTTFVPDARKLYLDLSLSILAVLLILTLLASDLTNGTDLEPEML